MNDGIAARTGRGFGPTTWIGRGFGALLLASLLLLWPSFGRGGLSYGPSDASAQNVEQSCMVSTLGCTANDVSLASGVAQISNACETAPFGTATVRFLFSLDVTAANRYDVSIYVSKNGLDPRQGSTSTNCQHEILRPISTSPNELNPSGAGPFNDADGDYCGDIRQLGTVDALFLTSPVTVTCVDANADGFVDIFTGTTWSQNQNELNCTDVSIAVAGTSSKCKVASLNVVGLQMPGRIDVTKNTLSSTLVSNNGGGSYTFDTVFQIKVQNTGLNDLLDVDVLDNLETTFGCTSCFTVTNRQIVASSLTYGGSVTLNAGYTGHPPCVAGLNNCNLLATATRRLDYDDVDPHTDQGDFVTINYTVRWTKTCPFSGSNRVDASGKPRLPLNNTDPRVTDFATVNLGCTPTAVNLKGLGADSGPSGDLLAVLLATLGLSGVAMLVTRRRDPFTAR